MAWSGKATLLRAALVGAGAMVVLCGGLSASFIIFSASEGQTVWSLLGLGAWALVGVTLVGASLTAIVCLWMLLAAARKGVLFTVATRQWVKRLRIAVWIMAGALGAIMLVGLMGALIANGVEAGSLYDVMLWVGVTVFCAGLVGVCAAGFGILARLHDWVASGRLDDAPISAITTRTLQATLLGLAALLLPVQIVYLPDFGRSIVEMEPAFAAYYVPGLVLSITGIACFQAFSVAMAGMIGCIGRGALLMSAATPWVRAVTVTAFAGAAAYIGCWAVLPAIDPPSALTLFLATALAGGSGALLLVLGSIRDDLRSAAAECEVLEPQPA